MLKPVWRHLFVLSAVLMIYGTGVHSQCWETSKCRDLSTESNLLECIKSCKSDLSAESPVYPGNGHMQPLSEDIRKYMMTHFRWDKFGRRNNETGNKREDGYKTPLLSIIPALESHNNLDMEEDSLSRQDDRRSYSMEHFRWGKPVGKKRRPIKVYPNGMEDESAESYSPDLRRDMPMEFDYPEPSSEEKSEENDIMNLLEKKDRNYRMQHFRWNSPPKDKRYGGFMKSWDERSQKPLMTLFKNVMIKDAYEKKGQ
ncbi:pro-opiomelanocortin [Protopterus annectens]|uniref:Proopiomelanocortin POMC n=1 Tax=Protopterus annectens TaxID=7888 RepID=Q9PWN1_PROAN|nr:pro-opiomelanocortin [Protopterus annectens]AAD29144.1 proopiomelanocortin POMC [Protopterus annectens]